VKIPEALSEGFENQHFFDLSLPKNPLAIKDRELNGKTVLI
jgi:hypothetical protein